MVGQDSTRTGFTLIEALVVVVIIAILMGLAIPAIFMAREAARRMHCASNLRQIGIALYAYESAQGSFPRAGGAASSSFLVALLPHLEQRALYDSLNFTSRRLLTRGRENSTALKVGVDLFHCPSDGMTPRFHPGSASNYAGNQGRGVQKYGYDGFFAVFEPSIGLHEITDGASQTVALSEWATGPQGLDREPLRTIFRTRQFTEPDALDLFAKHCRNVNIHGELTSTIGSGQPKGVGWFRADFGYSLYNHVIEPNGKSCVNGTRYQQGAWTAGSFHNSGVNALLADGRVIFVKENVDLGVWRALASRNGGDLANVGQ